jgi:hypothetical protein
MPLIVVASAAPGTAERVAERLRRDGSLVYATHSAQGCLRVATSVRPDMIVIDPALPARLERLLRAHPTSAHAQFVHLSDPMLRVLRTEVAPVASPAMTPVAAA